MPGRRRVPPARFGESDNLADESTSLPTKKGKAAPKGAPAAPIKLTLTLGGTSIAAAEVVTEKAPTEVPGPEIPQHSREELQLLEKYVELREALANHAKAKAHPACATGGAAPTTSTVDQAVRALREGNSAQTPAQKRPTAKRARSVQPAPTSFGSFGMSMEPPALPHGLENTGGAIAYSDDWD